MAVFTLIARVYGLSMDEIWNLTYPQIELYAWSASKQLEYESKMLAGSIAQLLFS